ncbi:MAG: universal stress protein [Bdellovibrionales bacterium]|nr:universal stress protein [Bdellovibrionales bacterium]
MKHFLIPTDCSNESERAFEVARQLVTPLNGRISLLTVITPAQTIVADSGMGTLPISTEVGPSHDTEDVKKYHREILQQYFPSIPGESIVIESLEATYLSVITCAQEHCTDVIVMSTHGRSGVGRVLLGSVAESVSRNTNIPVLLVPRAAS